MAGQPDFVGTIEAIYDVRGSLQDWLKNVLEAARSWYDGGEGVWGCSWRITAAGMPVFEAFVNVGGPPVSLIELSQAMPPDVGKVAAQILGADFVGLNSDIKPPGCREFFLAPLRPFGIADIHLINGRDVADRGVCIGAHLRRSPSRRWRSANEAVLARLARHLVAGNRLRARLEGGPNTDIDVAAILTPSGRLEHASPAAEHPEVRAALREAALAVDRARGAERHSDPEAAVRRWRVLADARFSLLDRFESDGRRTVIACENEPAQGGSRRLTARERQVVALYRAGAHSKLIAYELGLADATVRVLLSRAAHRVGAPTPRALRQMDLD